MIILRGQQVAKRTPSPPPNNLSTLFFIFHLPSPGHLDTFVIVQAPLLPCLHLQAIQQLVCPLLSALPFPSAKGCTVKRPLKRESRLLRFSLVFDNILIATCCRCDITFLQLSPCLQLSHLSQRRSLRLHPNLARAPSPPFQPSLLPHTHLLQPSEGLHQPPPGPRRPTLLFCLVKLRQSKRLPQRGNVHPIRKLSFSSALPICTTNLHHVAATNIPSSFSHRVQRKAWTAQDYREEGAAFITGSASYLQTQAEETGLVIKHLSKPDCHVIKAIGTLNSERERRVSHG